MDITDGEDEEEQIQEQLETLDQERDEIQEAYDSGSISEQEFKKLISKNKFQRAQLVEKNQQTVEQQQQRTHERARDIFND